ncbi:putative WRKY transcription factor 4 [Canna indica]|uniref:WRKY transcription factor 4 n=1 Tax=Canna indica TaxID=4628 RepID=A0AAQ3QPQ8_9LILI|nr:putative WRKY transcription factor 4 [Canna indica]
MLVVRSRYHLSLFLSSPSARLADFLVRRSLALILVVVCGWVGVGESFGANLMVEKGRAGGGGVVVGEEEVAAPRTGAPLRPTITLPPRSSFESLFRGGGRESKVSPRPLTLVPSFFAKDPDSDCSGEEDCRVHGGSGEGGGEVAQWWRTESGGGLVWLGQNRPSSLSISQQQMFTVPPVLSPVLFSSPLVCDSPG